MARAAIERVPGVAWFEANGTRVSFTLKPGIHFEEKTIAEAFTEQGLAVTGFQMAYQPRPGASWIVQAEGLG